MHDLKHQTATRLRQDSKHPLGIFERECDLAFEGFASICPACGILGANEEVRHVICANNDLGHGFSPRVLPTISSHSCWNPSVDNGDASRMDFSKCLQI
jgi:hypothetical protein